MHLNFRGPSPFKPFGRSPPRGSTARERERTEALLAHYPELDSAEIDELRHWFRWRASAADVALLACNEKLHDHYRAFRRLHVDPFNWWQKGIVILLAALPLALLAVALAGEA